MCKQDYNTYRQSYARMNKNEINLFLMPLETGYVLFSAYRNFRSGPFVCFNWMQNLWMKLKIRVMAKRRSDNKDLEFIIKDKVYK